MARLPIEPSGGVGSVKVRNGTATTGQTWVRGAVLVAASGLLSEGGTNPTAIVGIANAGVTSAAAGAAVSYIPAHPGQEFVMSVDDASDLGNGASAQTDIGTRYGITEDSSGIWYVDKNKTSDATVCVTVVDLQDAAATTQGRVKVVFNQHGDLGGTPRAITIYAGSV